MHAVREEQRPTSRRAPSGALVGTAPRSRRAAHHSHRCRGSRRRHVGLCAVATGMGLGCGARRQRSRRGHRQHDGVHDARSPRGLSGAHGHGSRAARARASDERHRGRRDHHRPARAPWPGWQRPRPGAVAEREAVLERLPRRLRGHGVRHRHQWPRVGGGAGGRCQGHLQPHQHPGLRRNASASASTRRAPGRSTLARLAACAGRATSHRRGAAAAPTFARHLRRTRLERVHARRRCGGHDCIDDRRVAAWLVAVGVGAHRQPLCADRSFELGDAATIDFSDV